MENHLSNLTDLRWITKCAKIVFNLISEYMLTSCKDVKKNLNYAPARFCFSVRIRFEALKLRTLKHCRYQFPNKNWGLENLRWSDHHSLLLEIFLKGVGSWERSNMVDYQFPFKNRLLEQSNNPTNIADHQFPNRNRKLTMKCSPLSPLKSSWNNQAFNNQTW